MALNGESSQNKIKRFLSERIMIVAVEVTYIWHLDLVSLLEVLRESLNEFPGGNVLDSNSSTCVDGRKLNL